MHILVTGSAGLLGSRLLPLLAQSIPNARIIATTRSSTKTTTATPGVAYVRADLRELSFWQSLPTTITHVFYLAAVIPWKPEDRARPKLMSENISPVLNLLEMISEWPQLKQIIYSSSISVYSPTTTFITERSRCDPPTIYGKSKLIGENLLATFPHSVSLRLSSIYGPDQFAGTVLPIMVKRARDKEPLIVFGDGSRTQDFIHVDDAARACLLCLQKGATGVYNVGSGVPVTMTELAQTVSEVFAEGTSQIIFRPEQTDTDQGMRIDISKIRSELNYQPMTLAEGLKLLRDSTK